MKVAAEFICSAADERSLPKFEAPELSLVGRSNVGKSSLINALVRRGIARTSAAPGKTRLANFFRVESDAAPFFLLVDLPGYGYARAPRQARGSAEARRQKAAEEFEAVTRAYFESRGHGKWGRAHFPGDPGSENRPDPVFRSACLLLVDSRHPGLAADAQASDWIDTVGMPKLVVATKLDKLNRAERTRNLKELERIHHGPVAGVSAQTGEGLEDLWKLIARLLRQPLPTPAAPPPPRNPPPSTSPR